MSYKAALFDRVDGALSRITFTGLATFAAVILMFSFFVYAGISGMIDNADTRQDQREFLQILKPLWIYAIEAFVGIIVVLGLLKIAWDIRQEAQDYAEKLSAESKAHAPPIDQLI